MHKNIFLVRIFCWLGADPFTKDSHIRSMAHKSIEHEPFLFALRPRIGLAYYGLDVARIGVLWICNLRTAKRATIMCMSPIGDGSSVLGTSCILHVFLCSELDLMNLRSNVVEKGFFCFVHKSCFSVHRLITYIYFHEDLPTLVCSCLIVWYFGGGFEENVGTVKFCFLTPLFAVWNGLLYLVVIATGISFQLDGKVQGFTAVAFSMVSVFIIRTRLRRLILFGFMVPTKVMPLLFLIPAAFIPHATTLSNVCGILVGLIYGMGGCFFLDPSESLLSRLDQMVPFKVLKSIPVWRYIPATSAERIASQARKINPPPGSYPTQQYYTPPQGLPDIYSPYHHMKPTSYPTGTGSGQPNSHDSPGAHSNNANNSLVAMDLNSQKDNAITSDQPDLQQVQTL